MAVEFEATHGALWPARSLRGGLSSGINCPRVLPSSSGLGHRPLTAKIAGSNPVGSTKFLPPAILTRREPLAVTGDARGLGHRTGCPSGHREDRESSLLKGGANTGYRFRTRRGIKRLFNPSCGTMAYPLIVSSGGSFLSTAGRWSRSATSSKVRNIVRATRSIFAKSIFAISSLGW